VVADSVQVADSAFLSRSLAPDKVPDVSAVRLFAISKVDAPMTQVIKKAVSGNR
jgi:hypothetical protein